MSLCTSCIGLQIQREPSYKTGESWKAKLYANVLWCTSVTARQQPIGIIFVPTETNAEIKFTIHCQGVLNKTEGKLITAVSWWFMMCLQHRTEKERLVKTYHRLSVSGVSTSDNNCPVGAEWVNTCSAEHSQNCSFARAQLLLNMSNLYVWMHHYRVFTLTVTNPSLLKKQPRTTASLEVSDKSSTQRHMPFIVYGNLE